MERPGSSVGFDGRIRLDPGRVVQRERPGSSVGGASRFDGRIYRPQHGLLDLAGARPQLGRHRHDRPTGRRHAAGTGSGSPTTTCRTPRTARYPTATRTSAGRSCRLSPRPRRGSASARSCHRHRCTIRRCSPTGSRRSITSRTVARCSASAPVGRSTNTGAYGIELAPPGERVGRFDESIQIVRSLLDQPRTTFAGRYYTIDDAPCAPKPIQSPLPILVGTSGSRMLRITARHADEWNTWGDVETAATKTTAFLAACEAVGRDPATMRRSVQAIVFLEDDAATLAQLRENAPAGRSIVGSPVGAGRHDGQVPRPRIRRVHRPRMELRPRPRRTSSPSSTGSVPRSPTTSRASATDKHLCSVNGSKQSPSGSSPCSCCPPGSRRPSRRDRSSTTSRSGVAGSHTPATRTTSTSCATSVRCSWP